jgi:hypothetical protein
MSIKTHVLMAVCLSLLMQTFSTHAQNLIPANNADLYPLGATGHAASGRPHNFARLFVQLEVVPTCTIDDGASMSIRCTRGVPYRAWILNDTDKAFGRTQVFDSRSAGSNKLVRIEAQRLDVEF